MLGTTLKGRYHIIKELGSGAFGQTYIAEDRDLPGHPPCAVKRLQPTSNQLFVLQTAQRLFEQEAKILQRLGNHQQIPRLLAHVEENQEFYLGDEPQKILQDILDPNIVSIDRGGSGNSFELIDELKSK